MPFLLGLVEADWLAGRVVNDVAFDEKPFAALVKEDAVVWGTAMREAATVNIINQVATKNSFWLETQRIDATSIGNHLHDVVNVVVFHQASALAGD